MSVQMDKDDSKLEIRLKWLYLFPFFLLVLIPVCFIVGWGETHFMRPKWKWLWPLFVLCCWPVIFSAGWTEYGIEAFHFAWISIRYGTPFDDDGED